MPWPKGFKDVKHRHRCKWCKRLFSCTVILCLGQNECFRPTCIKKRPALAAAGDGRALGLGASMKFLVMEYVNGPIAARWTNNIKGFKSQAFDSRLEANQWLKRVVGAKPSQGRWRTADGRLFKVERA